MIYKYLIYEKNSVLLQYVLIHFQHCAWLCISLIVIMTATRSIVNTDDETTTSLTSVAIRDKQQVHRTIVYRIEEIEREVPNDEPSEMAHIIANGAGGIEQTKPGEYYEPCSSSVIRYIKKKGRIPELLLDYDCRASCADCQGAIIPLLYRTNILEPVEGQDASASPTSQVYNYMMNTKMISTGCFCRYDPTLTTSL